MPRPQAAPWATPTGAVQVIKPATAGSTGKQYRVQGRWLDDLWTDEKLDNDTYEAYALRVRLGFAERKRNLEAVREASQSQNFDGF